ncbi:MAG TPA: EVE domain-containing protein [Candidatus Limnocylindrales bacterium]|nr:EVE domain-containing protein [Candidatus Limnocylindrales bacterium]
MAERRYWVGVSAGDHVDKGRDGGFVMFAHGKHDTVNKLSPGDRFAYYAPMTGMNAGDVIRKFVAIGEILDEAPAERVMRGGTGWSRPARYFKASPADVYPLLDKLSFIHDRQHWGMAFRRSLFAVTDADFALIARAMGVSR